MKRGIETVPLVREVDGHCLVEVGRDGLFDGDIADPMSEIFSLLDGGIEVGEVCAGLYVAAFDVGVEDVGALSIVKSGVLVDVGFAEGGAGGGGFVRVAELPHEGFEVFEAVFVQGHGEFEFGASGVCGVGGFDIREEGGLGGGEVEGTAPVGVVEGVGDFGGDFVPEEEDTAVVVWVGAEREGGSVSVVAVAVGLGAVGVGTFPVGGNVEADGFHCEVEGMGIAISCKILC